MISVATGGDSDLLEEQTPGHSSDSAHLPSLVSFVRRVISHFCRCRSVSHNRTLPSVVRGGTGADPEPSGGTNTRKSHQILF